MTHMSSSGPRSDDQKPGSTWAPALLWDSEASSREVTCRLCPHSCQLADGETGVCRMRANQGGALEIAALSVTVAHLDPIERKPFFHVP
jgi:pyruvate formate lyase activating enzyme